MYLPNVLLDGTVMVSLKVKVITVLSEDLRQPVTVQVLALGQVYSHHKQILLKQHLKKQDLFIDRIFPTFHQLQKRFHIPDRLLQIFASS